MSDEERVEHQPLDQPITILGRLTNRAYYAIQSGAVSVVIPHGVHMMNRAGSKQLTFVCDNEVVADELVNGLENSGIVWEEDYISEEV